MCVWVCALQASRRWSSSNIPDPASKGLSPLEQFKAKLPVISAGSLLISLPTSPVCVPILPSSPFAVTGAIVVSYGVSKVVLWMTGQFMSLNFTTVAYIGFACGCVCVCVHGLVNFHTVSECVCARVCLCECVRSCACLCVHVWRAGY